MFKLAADDNACTHILYAACHDASYLAQLVSYSGLRNKITLVQGAGFNPDFHQFSLNVTQFPTIFRWSDLPSGTPSSKASTFNSSDRTATPLKANKAAGLQNLNQSSPRKDISWNSFGADTTYGAQEPSSAGGYSHPETNGWGVKTDAKKPQPQVKCKYFAKVPSHPTCIITLFANFSRASVVTETNVASRTSPTTLTLNDRR